MDTTIQFPVSYKLPVQDFSFLYPFLDKYASNIPPNMGKILKHSENRCHSYFFHIK